MVDQGGVHTRPRTNVKKGPEIWIMEGAGADLTL